MQFYRDFAHIDKFDTLFTLLFHVSQHYLTQLSIRGKSTLGSIPLPKRIVFNKEKECNITFSRIPRLAAVIIHFFHWKFPFTPSNWGTNYMLLMLPEARQAQPRLTRKSKIKFPGNPPFNSACSLAHIYRVVSRAPISPIIPRRSRRSPKNEFPRIHPRICLPSNSPGIPQETRYRLNERQLGSAARRRHK